MIPLISVLIPIYNVEKYLRQCLDSVINQTYRNLEIILIDDGSTDNSGKICDEYTFKDNRIKVIHKQNGGSVSARKIGIEQAKGKFISFVDSDDWIDNDFIQYLFDLKESYNADISVCGTYGQYSKYLFYKKPFVCNKEKSFKVIFNDKFFAGYMWNKLYPKEIFNNIMESKQDMFEDLFFQTQIILKTKSIVFSSKRKYHYRVLANTISHKKFNKDKIFYFNIVKQVKKVCKQNDWQSLYDDLVISSIVAAFRNIIHIKISKNQDKILLQKMKNKFLFELKKFYHLDKNFLIRNLKLLYSLLHLFISDIYKLFIDNMNYE